MRTGYVKHSIFGKRPKKLRFGEQAVREELLTQKYFATHFITKVCLDPIFRTLLLLAILSCSFLPLKKERKVGHHQTFFQEMLGVIIENSFSSVLCCNQGSSRGPF